MNMFRGKGVGKGGSAVCGGRGVEGGEWSGVRWRVNRNGRGEDGEGEKAGVGKRVREGGVVGGELEEAGKVLVSEPCTVWSACAVVDMCFFGVVASCAAWQ